MPPFEDQGALARPDILILFEGNEIIFGAESEAADRWMRRAWPGRLDTRWARIKKFAHAAFRAPAEEPEARAFQEAARKEGFRFC